MDRLVKWFKAWKLVSLRSAAVAAFLIYTIAGFLVVPAVAKKLIVDTVFDLTGREVTVGKVRCNPFALTFTVRGFSMPDRPNSTMVSFEEFYANAQLSSIFRWAATLKELRVTSPFVALRRFEDGTFNILQLLEDIEERAPEKDEEEGGLPRALLYKILVQDIRAEYQDLAQEEPVLEKIGPGKLELHHISTLPNRKGTNELNISLERGGTLRVTGELVVEPFGINGTAALEGISLAHPWEAIREKFEFDVVSGTASGELSYSAHLEADGLHVTVTDFDSRVQELAIKLRDSEVDVLEMPSLVVAGGHFLWPDGRVGAAVVTVDGAKALGWLGADGTPAWQSLIPEDTRVHVKKVYKDVSEAAAWVASVDRFEIISSSARYEDRTFDPPVELWVEEANLVLTDVITEPEREWGLSGSVQLFGESPTDAEGFFQMEPLHLEAQVNVNDLDISRAQPYVARFAPVRLLSGTMSSSVKGILSPGGEGPLAQVTGQLAVEQFGLEETAAGSRLTRWDLVKAGGMEAAYGPISLAVDTVDIHGARIDGLILEDGRVNLLELVAALAEQTGGQEAGAQTTDQAPGSDEMPPIEIAEINLHDCTAAYTDRTLTPPFTLALQAVNGRVTGVSSTAGSRASLEIEGSVESGGAVELKGEMDLFDPTRATDISIDVRRTNLPPMSPMSVLFIGYPLDMGRADLDLDYRITDANLEGDNQVVTKNLTLGEKVEGQGKLDLPIALGVSLLTDSEGLITLEVPVSGSLDDPGFGIGSAVGQATKTIIGNIVSAPFSLLGKLGGGSGEEDLGFVEFEAGGSRLDVAAIDRLKILASGLEQRPSLILLVEGVWDGESDPVPLREAKFNALLAERPETLELLESLFREGHTDEELAALRAPHLTQGEAAVEPRLDEEAYRRDLRAALVASQVVDQDALRALGEARGQAVRSYLVDTAGVDSGRIEVTEPVPAAAASGERMRCRLDVRTGT